MQENELIRMFAGIHGPEPYRGDADPFGGMLFSTDSFSETEDFFTDTPPEQIGRNMALGACTDLLACGVKPEILLQCWNIDSTKNQEYYRRTAEGIESVLRHYGAKCIGGDIGASQPWIWSATVAARAENPVTRIAKKRVPFDLYVSGPLGDVNMAVFSRRAMPELELRPPVPQHALFATDTSGGFFDALENFRRVNCGMNMILDLSNVFAAETPFNPVYTLIGGAGEYELLYAVPQGEPTEGICLGSGSFTCATAGNRLVWHCGRQHGIMYGAPPDYRDIPPDRWLEATENYLAEMVK